MLQDNIERVRKGFEDFNRRDFDAALAAFPDDVTWAPYLSRAESPQVLRGKEQIRAAWESQVETLDLRAEPDEFIPVGRDKVVVPCRLVAHGSGSDMSLTASIAWVWTFADDGLSVTIELYESREEALEAAGPARPGGG